MCIFIATRNDMSQCEEWQHWIVRQGLAAFFSPINQNNKSNLSGEKAIKGRHFILFFYF